MAHVTWTSGESLCCKLQPWMDPSPEPPALAENEDPYGEDLAAGSALVGAAVAGAYRYAAISERLCQREAAAVYRILRCQHGQSAAGLGGP